MNEYIKDIKLIVTILTVIGLLLIIYIMANTKVIKPSDEFYDPFLQACQLHNEDYKPKVTKVVLDNGNLGLQVTCE